MDKETAEQYQAQEILQKQQLNSPQQQSFAPQLFEQVQRSEAVLVEQTNPKRIVKDIVLRLKGMELLPNGQEVVVATPKMNKKGIEKMSFLLESHINQGVILSHLDEKIIGNMIITLSEDLVDSLALNWREFGIKDKTDLDDINNSVLMNVFLALKRAEGQNEKNWLGKISVENIGSGTQMPGVKKGGFWDKFKFGG